MQTRIRKRTIVVLVCLVAITWLTASWVLQGRVSGEQVKLPTPEQLAAVDIVPAMPTSSAHFSLAGGEMFMQGGQTESLADQYVLQSDGSGAFCIYEIGPLVPADVLSAVSVTTQWVDEQPLEYRVAFADFGTGKWQYSPVIDQGRTRAAQIPELRNPLSPAGRMYIAVRVDGPAAIGLEQVDVNLDLARSRAARIEFDGLTHEIINAPVALPLTARDENGRIDLGFNETITVTADSGSASVSCEATFTNGQARPTLTFSEQGTYNFATTGTGSKLDGPLGTMALYETQLPVYTLYIDPDTLQEMETNLASNQYQTGQICLAGSNASPAKIRYRGCSRRFVDKRSWKVKLAEGAQFDDAEWGYKRDSLNLVTDPRDSTMLREKLSYDLMRDMEVPAPRTRFIHLRVNDVFQGLYMDVENPRKQWLAAMGFDNDGSMYKAAPGNLSRLSKVSEYEDRYEKKTREDESYNDLAELCASLDEIRDEDETSVRQNLDELFYMDQLTNYMAVLALVSSRENWMHNYYLYHDQDETGKWLIFPWDMDMTWSFDNPGRLMADDPLDKFAGSNVLTTIFFNNQELMDRYRQTLADALDTVFTEEHISQRIDEYYATICQDVVADWQKKSSDGEYAARVESLKQYVTDRSEFIQREIASS